jgi:hypothetical protein
MKHAKILFFSATALIALTAMAGTASATYLTSPSGTTYTGTIKAINEGAVTLTSVFGGFGTISCKESEVEGTVESHGASVTAGWKGQKLTFRNCTGGEPTSVTKIGFFRFHATATTGNATVTTGAVELVIHKTLFGTCTYSAPITEVHLGTLTGSNITGGNAILHMLVSMPGPCGTGTLQGTYKLTTPSFLAVH